MRDYYNYDFIRDDQDFDVEYCEWLYDLSVRDSEAAVANQGVGDCFVSEIQCEEFYS